MDSKKKVITKPDSARHDDAGMGLPYGQVGEEEYVRWVRHHVRTERLSRRWETQP